MSAHSRSYGSREFSRSKNYESNDQYRRDSRRHEDDWSSRTSNKSRASRDTRPPYPASVRRVQEAIKPPKPKVVEMPTGPDVDYQAHLESIYPAVTLSVEMPYSGNGNLFQVRTVIMDEIFYGRAQTEEEAISKCCQKAVKFIYQRDTSLSGPTKPSKRMSDTSSAKVQSRRESADANANYPRSALDRRVERERELRGGLLGSVLDKVDAWNRKSMGQSESPRERQEWPEPPRRSKGRRDRGKKTQPSSKRDISPAAASDLTSATQKSKLSYDLDDTSSQTGSVDWKYKQIPIKNAVMMLNEMFPPPSAPQYKVTSQTGPPNNPTFTMVCCIKNQSFVGEGKSKKEAKLACSQKAIEEICGHKLAETQSMPEKSNPRASCDLDDWMELEGKNPVSILNELYPGIQYQLVSTSGPSHAPIFIMRASLNDISFEGSGKSKKDAKLNASKALLVHLHKVGFDPMTGVMMSTQQDNSEVAEGHSLADKIAQLVTAKYQALFGATTYSKRRVMAGIVMTRNFFGFNDNELNSDGSANAEVICVTSGTKCINGAQLCLEGRVVNDSHAEIVTRRCIIIFFYQELVKWKNNEESIFELDEDGIFKLKDGIEFHLFITTSPCGDARIFSLHESANPNGAGAQSGSSRNKQEAQTQNPIVKSHSVVGLSSELDLKSESEDMTESKSEPDLTHLCASDDSGIEPDLVTSLVKIFDENDNESVKELNLDGEDAVKEDESVKEDGSVQNVERRQADSSKGMLRSKIECGMGTVPISQKLTIQTWDGVLSGDRLLTMACSDKIMRWNVVGVQGALLTHLIRPVYFKSVTVGSKFHPGHMKRALFERIADHITDLPEHYKLNVPQLYATTSPETRQATKAHDYSVNWIIDAGQPEIVNGSTGKTISDNTSRLSKRSLFEQFLSVSETLEKSIASCPVRYSNLKEMAKNYQDAKNKVGLALVAAGCGHWVEKPVEQDQFSL